MQSRRDAKALKVETLDYSITTLPESGSDKKPSIRRAYQLIKIIYLSPVSNRGIQ